MEQQTLVGRILFATDFSENSRAALDYTRMLAMRFHSKVIMLHVVLLSQAAQEAELEIQGPSLSREMAERRLETLAKELRRCGIEVETHIVEGFAGDVIPPSISTYQANLLVLGIHGLHHGLTYLLMGSTTELLLRNASCPVLTVGANVLCGFDLSCDLERVLFISDFSPEAAFAAPFAISLAKSLDVPIELGVWLSDRVRTDEEERWLAADKYCRTIRDIGETRQPEWCQPDVQLSCSLDTEEMVKKAAREHNGLIVLGIHSLNTSFARLILSRASCPVVTLLKEATLAESMPA